MTIDRKSYNKVNYRNDLAKRKGFENYGAYLKHLANINRFDDYTDFQANSMGFESKKEYKDYLARQMGFVDNNDYSNAMRHSNGTSISMSENKGSSQYMGIYITEKNVSNILLNKMFSNIEYMTYGNIGYDVICDKNTIDIKSSIKRRRTKNLYNWSFHIDKNTISNYFLMFAFDNKIEFNICHVWMIKGSDIIREKVLNSLTTLSVIDSDIPIKKLEKFEIKGKVLNETIKEWNIIKKEKI